jgi:SAM-dependent methyltransferase
VPKKIRFESFRYHFLSVARTVQVSGDGMPGWQWFLDRLNFQYYQGKVVIDWGAGQPGTVEFMLDEPHLYLRGDSAKNIERLSSLGVLGGEDAIKSANKAYFRGTVSRVAEAAGYMVQSGSAKDAERYDKERVFHDAWADSEEAAQIDVCKANEVCTAPEMRYVTQRLGDLRGRTLLDVGCGLGEASVYFALHGASVTSMDISGGMLDATRRLADRYGVKVRTHQSAAEELLLAPDEKFDVIYAGNLLHHVDILHTVKLLKPHLAASGVLITWDPLAYNPAINIYRRMATAVRTEDEHPLKWADITGIKSLFPRVETRYFWLSTLVIFLVMALVQRRNPNKERFWKVVVEEGDKWEWLYRPLERLDRFLLAVFPPLRLLCWNVVIVARAE